MNLVTSRIISNVLVHGVEFALVVEMKRARRAGRSREAAITWAVEAVKAAIIHAGVRA